MIIVLMMEHLLATFNEHRVLLVLCDSDATALYPMLKHRVLGYSNKGIVDKHRMFWSICP